MSEITPELAPEIVAACTAGADEAAAALGRALEVDITLAVGEAGTYDPATTPDGFDGAGLALLMKFGDVGVAALVPENTALLPDDYANAANTSKFSTLAQELSMLLLPESLLAEDFQAARVESLQDALASAGVAPEAAYLPLQLSADDKSGALSLIWPLARPEGLLPTAAGEEASDAAPSTAEPSAEINAPVRKPRRNIQDFSQLPGYSRSLLRIETSVRVVLATKKESLQDVVELAAGSIIKFDKPCDEMLHLQVGDHRVAMGEAVKVGDKFGFRVSSMVMPEEHFMKVQPKRTG